MSQTLTARATVREIRWGVTIKSASLTRYEGLMLDLDLDEGLNGNITLHVDDPAWAASFPVGTVLRMTLSSDA